MKTKWRYTARRLSRQALIMIFLMGLSETIWAASTPDYWQCSSRIGGEWNFGRAPSACIVDWQQDPTYVRSEFTGVLFEEKSSDRNGERARYMNEAYALIRDSVHYYLKRRNPKMSQAEVDGFLLGIYSLLHQESYWTHYRHGTDNKVRYMRGDSGHGHGMMQVDDRSHISALKQGKGVDMIYNLLYGLDIYYSAWVKAASASCVNNPSDYRSRARSAWSAYNGGPSRICRWADSKSAYAANDKNYRTKIDGRSWLKWVADPSKVAGLDAQCLSEGVRPCAPPSQPAPTTGIPRTGQLYILENGNYCLFDGKGFSCLSEYRDVVCLEVDIGQSLQEAETLARSIEQSYPINKLDRHEYCRSQIVGLQGVGSQVRLGKNINLRRTPGGDLIATLSAGEVYQVLDFEVNKWQNEDRYYQVYTPKGEGYIFAGGASDYDRWSVKVNNEPLTLPVPGLGRVGDWLEIVASGGINLRRTPAGEFLLRVPVKERVQVLDLLVRGDESQIYYGVRFDGTNGYIYGGSLKPKQTLLNWVGVAAVLDKNLVTYFMLKPGVTYKTLRECIGPDCDYVVGMARGPALASACIDSTCAAARPDWFTILSENSSSSDGAKYVQVKVVRTGIVGWLLESDLVEVVP